MTIMKSTPALGAAEKDIFGIIDEDWIHDGDRIYAIILLSVALLLRSCLLVPEWRATWASLFAILTLGLIRSSTAFLLFDIDTSATLKYEIIFGDFCHQMLASSTGT